MYRFYDSYVRLEEKDRTKMRGYKKKNIDRLGEGLKKIECDIPFTTCVHGSYAMWTMVQHPENDYDIDIAVIFDKNDLPGSALEARQLVRDAMCAVGYNFKTPPEAKPNAVAITYEEGYHVDLPVYREYMDDFGRRIIEHAGAEWTKRDPVDITEWFKNEVATKSPSTTYATVKEHQMRRIVRLLKMFTKSRAASNLPGGLLLTVLTSECYAPDAQRDDKALYNTVKAISSRLNHQIEIYNPVLPDVSLTYKDSRRNQVRRLKEQLDIVLPELEPICNQECSELDAYKAWNIFFQHEYWTTSVKSLEMRMAGSRFVSSTGFLSNIETPNSTPSLPHQFFGDE